MFHNLWKVAASSDKFHQIQIRVMIAFNKDGTILLYCYIPTDISHLM